MKVCIRQRAILLSVADQGYLGVYAGPQYAFLRVFDWSVELTHARRNRFDAEPDKQGAVEKTEVR